jgi:hemerythrin
MTYWRNDFTSGIYQIDEAHQQLLSHVVELEMALEHGRPTEEAQDIAYRLGILFDEHVSIESKLARIHRISRMTYYSLEHQRQLCRLENLVACHIDESTITSIRATLIDHISGDVAGICHALYKHGIR